MRGGFMKSAKPKMKSFKPNMWEMEYWHIEGNDLFIDVAHLKAYRTSNGNLCIAASRFGKDFFIFDVNSCEFLEK